jgi:hypothetical protein
MDMAAGVILQEAVEQRSSRAVDRRDQRQRLSHLDEMLEARGVDLLQLRVRVQPRAG